MSKLTLHGARKIDADGRVDDFWFVAEGDRIVETGTGDGWRPHASGHVVAAGGRWLTPGFIDLHAHGGGGHAFDDGPAEIEAGLAAHRRHGTTRSVVSLVSSPLARTREGLVAIARLADEDPLVLGSHLEGPFLAPSRRGAHNPEFLRRAEPHLVGELLNSAGGTMRQVTIAPELPGALEVIDLLTENGVAVALGHTEASDAQAQLAFGRGARVLTHAFNAMPGIHHRDPGPLVAAFEDDRVTIELILDGLHVHPDVARLVFALAAGRVALVTDAMAAAGSDDGNYRLGSLNVTVSGGVAVLSGTDTIAGSTLTQDRALHVAVEDVGLDPVAAVEALTLTPARALGLENDLGLLRAGHAADAVLLDDDWAVHGVWAAGRAIIEE